MCKIYLKAYQYIFEFSVILQIWYGTGSCNSPLGKTMHDDVIKREHFPRYWPFVRGIHRHKGQWRRALMFSFICVWIDNWVKNHEADDLRRYCAHYDVTVMINLPWKINIEAADDLEKEGPSAVRASAAMSLRWRHNAHDGVSNHLPHDCLLNRLFGRRSK